MISRSRRLVAAFAALAALPWVVAGAAPSFAARYDVDGDGRSDVVAQSDERTRTQIAWSAGAFDQVRVVAPIGGRGMVGHWLGLATTQVAVVDVLRLRWAVPRADGSWAVFTYGRGGDLAVPGNYAGSPATQAAVFRPSEGRWYIQGAPAIAFGRSDDIPVPADYDGDGVTDIAVFRPATGQWFIRGRQSLGFGRLGDEPVPADYDGDGDDDVAVARRGPGLRWYVLGGTARDFGRATDQPLPADYDGDGDDDVAVYRAVAGAVYSTTTATPLWAPVVASDGALISPAYNGTARWVYALRYGIFWSDGP